MKVVSIALACAAACLGTCFAQEQEIFDPLLQIEREAKRHAQLNPESSGLDRRLNEKAKAQEEYAGFKGVNIQTDNAVITLGKADDVKLARTGKGKLTVQADVAVNGKFSVGGTDVMAEVSKAKEGPVVHYGDKKFFHCKDKKSRRCRETSSLQHGSSREIIISGNQNLGNFELEFFVRGNSFVEVMATVMHCGGGCHSDFIDKKFAFNGYMSIREMRNDGYTDVGGTTGETTWKQKKGAHKTGGHWEVTRRITSWNQHGSYSGIMRLRHVKGSYTYGGPYYIRVRSSNHDLGLVRHIDEPASTCLFDCGKKKCNGKQPKGKACTCYVSGTCPEVTWSAPASWWTCTNCDKDKKISLCC